MRKEKEKILGSRSCHSHLIICGHAEEAKLAQGFMGSSTICCLKDEDVITEAHGLTLLFPAFPFKDAAAPKKFCG